VTLAELVEILGGKLVQGSPAIILTGVNSSELAGPSELAFAEDAASAATAMAGNAGAIIVRNGTGASCLSTLGSDGTATRDGAPSSSLRHKSVIETAQPRLWFARAAKLLNPAAPPTGIHPTAVLGVDAELGEDVTVGPFAFIRARHSIPESLSAIEWSSMPARFSGLMGLATCATKRPAHTRSSRSRERW
jgi:UDP-3-O-[3-hydroxymyristoyl] glucosamine N-acyltransferase